MHFKFFPKSALNTTKQHIGWPLAAIWAKSMAQGIRPPAFIGAYPNRETALAHVPATKPNSYNHDEIAPLNFHLMSETHIWDYPILYWLDRLIQPEIGILDAGGHFGTKFIAFRDRIPLNNVHWNVFDLPAIIRTARKMQEDGVLPAQISFSDELSTFGNTDILLASGLLQYLDQEFHAFLKQLPEPPKHILLNKVATREGETVVSLEKIGPGRIPYQIRNRVEFENSVAEMGYIIRDSWHIPSLSRKIATHPSLGASISRGYYLERTS